MENIQTHLEKNSSKNDKKIEIIIEKKEGKLVIADYPNLQIIKILNVDSSSMQQGPVSSITIKNLPSLEELTIIGCETRVLEIENCPLIKSLRLRKNLLGNLNFLNGLTNLENLIYLSINDNMIIEQDLSYFSKFINLETLSIGENNFTGSLIYLKELSKLETLDISHTNIDANELDSLPLSLKRIICQSKEGKKHKCYEIEKKLKLGWRKAKPEKNRNNINFFSIQNESIKKIEEEIENFIMKLKSSYDEEEIKEAITRKIYQTLDDNQLNNLKNETQISIETTNNLRADAINGATSIANWVSAVATVISLFKS